jgi:hypothetical protein
MDRSEEGRGPPMTNGDFYGFATTPRTIVELADDSIREQIKTTMFSGDNYELVWLCVKPDNKGLDYDSLQNLPVLVGSQQLWPTDDLDHLKFRLYRRLRRVAVNIAKNISEELFGITGVSVEAQEKLIHLSKWHEEIIQHANRLQWTWLSDVRGK